MKHIMKIVQPIEESRLLIKRISETIKNERKEKKVGFHPIILGALVASLLSVH